MKVDRIRSGHAAGAARTALLAAALALFAAGLALGVLANARIRGWLGKPSGQETTPAVPSAEERQLWTCGMHPQVIQDRPGTCPICGMALTPLTPAQGGAAPAGGEALAIDPRVVQSMGLRVADVVEGPLQRHVRAAGVLVEAEPNRVDVSSRVDGWIDVLHADFDGKHVVQGEPLFELYSPALAVAVEELIAARKLLDGTTGSPGTAGLQPGTSTGQATRSPNPTAVSLHDAALQKLAQYGVDPVEIERLDALDHAPRAITFRAPVTGHVLDKEVRAGAAVKAGELVLRIVDHTLLWLEVRVFEEDLPYVHPGQRVTARLAGTGASVEGDVIFIHPHLDEVSRTALVRASVANPELALRPGMFATAELAIEIAPRALLVPREAVIDTGERQIAFVALEGGHFEPRTLELGAEGDEGLVQVLSGLTSGERVVTSGQFLLDAESRTREGIQRFLEGQAAPDGHAHGGEQR